MLSTWLLSQELVGRRTESCRVCAVRDDPAVVCITDCCRMRRQLLSAAGLKLKATPDFTLNFKLKSWLKATLKSVSESD